MDFSTEPDKCIIDMKDALAGGGGGGGGGTKVWAVNNLAGEGRMFVVSSLAKAKAVPAHEPSDRCIYGNPESPAGAPYTVVGGKVAANDKVTLILIGDGGCIADVLRVYKDKAEAEAGLARITAIAEGGGWSAWTQELTIDAVGVEEEEEE